MRRRRLTFLEVKNDELYNPDSVRNVCKVYYKRTLTSCKLIYYELDEDLKYHKRLRQISFTGKQEEPQRCVLTFLKIAKKHKELIPFEPNAPKYDNGVYTYFSRPFRGHTTVLDMNSAYLWALTQPLPDWETKEEVDVWDAYYEKHEYYCVENDMHRKMFYYKDYEGILAASLWAGCKIYGFKASRHFEKTAEELYRLKCEVDRKKYKNVANIFVGCLHKRSGERNNTTLAAGLYALFEWKIEKLVGDFKKKGYNVIMINTDSIKIAGDYNEKDNLVEIGNGLGQFKYEYVGPAEFISEGHYKEKEEKWKGKPKYMFDGTKPLQFIDNLEEEKTIYEEYAKID